MSNGWLMARPLSGNCSQIATLFSPIWIAATLTAIFLALAIVLDLFLVHYDHVQSELIEHCQRHSRPKSRVLVREQLPKQARN